LLPRRYAACALKGVPEYNLKSKIPGGKDLSTDEKNGAGQSRRTFLKTGAGAVVGLMAGPGIAGASDPSPQQTPSGKGDPRPNFLFLLGEGVRHDELSFAANPFVKMPVANRQFAASDWLNGRAGNPIIQTPNLDRLGYEGINFRNMFVVNALCSPSRATILTGLYSHTTGCLDNQDRHIPPNVPIFSDLLHDAGYDTACFGKAHIRNALTDRYWDYYFGFDGAATSYYHPKIIEGRAGKFGGPQIYDGYVDDLVTDKAVGWLSQEREKPFFCLFMFQAPHAPFYRSRRNLDLYNGVPIPKPVTFDDDRKGYPGKPRAFANADNKIGTTILGADDPRSLEELVKDHFAGVVNNDQNFYSMIEALEKTGKLDDTVILFTADHGFFLGEWRFYDKRFMHEPSIRVPLLIRYPKLIEAGSVVDKMVLNLDLAPTVLDLAGVQIPAQMQGKTLVPFLKGSAPATWREDWLYEYYEYPGNQQVKPNRGVRTDRYKLIHYYLPPEEFELYDLQNDPGELYNLHGDPRYERLFRELMARIEELRRETGDVGAGQQTHG
jgi:arylsulfatase A-like enzyme